MESVSILLIVVWETILQWYTGEVEKSDIRFHNSLHLSKQVSNSANSFTVTGRAGMAFIRY